MWLKARILFAEVMAAYACVKALLRRQFVYGVMVAPSDPQLMEGGGTCPICQVSRDIHGWSAPSYCCSACQHLARRPLNF